MSLSGTELQALAGRLQTGIQAAAARNDTALLRAVLREALFLMEPVGSPRSASSSPRSASSSRRPGAARFRIVFAGRQREVCDPNLARPDAEALWLCSGERVAIVDAWTGDTLVAFPDAYQG